MGYYETYEDGKERWVPEPGDPVNRHGVSYDPNDPWSQWTNAQGQLDVPGWEWNLANAQRLVEAQGLPFGANEQRGGYSRWFNPSTGEWPVEYHARQENAGPFGLPSWVAPLMALAAVGTAGAGSALLGPGAAGAAGAASAGSAAAAPAAAGGASLLGIPTSTLSTIGTISGLGGTGLNVLGSLTGEEWLSKLGMGLGAAGGIAGGLGGLSNLFSTGINSFSDAVRLASNAGRVVGGIGRLADNDVLTQAGGYLGTAGQLGGGVDRIANVFGGGVQDLTDAARLASGVGQVAGAAGRITGNRPLQQASGLLGLGGRLGGNVGGLLGAAGQAQQRGVQPGAGPVPRTMSDQDWLSQRWQGQQPQSVLWNL